MRVKTKVIEETTLEEYMNDFIRFKMANKAAERTISDLLIRCYGDVLPIIALVK